MFVQNPSLGLTALATLLRPVLGYTLVVDAHNEGVRPFIRSGWFWRRVTRWLLGAADVTIVTNSYLVEDVNTAGGKPVILPDPLPDIKSKRAHSDVRAKPQVLVIATYAPDEPIPEIIEAATICEEDVDFLFSGKMPPQITGMLPANARSLGYLQEDEFYAQMATSTVIIDLTKMEHCLVCGAYEAMALGVPLVLTDDPASRELFGQGIRFTSNTPAEIADAIQDVCQNSELYHKEIIAAADRYRKSWTIMADDAVEEVNIVSMRRDTRAE